MLKKSPKQTLLLILSGLTVLVLVAAGCGSDSNETVTDTPPPTTTQADTPAPTTTQADTPDTQDSSVQPTSLVMARANWTTGYFQASLIRKLAQELGYEVTDPAETELGPSLAYLAMAEGDIDFWANGWFPLHNSWLLNELPDATLVGEYISPIGGLLAGSAIQAYFITKSFADEFGIETLDDLNDNPEALAEYDRYDETPGNGIAEIYGCPEAWTCDDVIQNQISFSGWENISQVRVGYEAMIADAVRLINDDRPTVVYSWTPSSYILNLKPGELTYWLGVEDVLDDSNPLGLDGGEGHDQRPGTLEGVSAEECPDLNEEGACTTGWIVVDILVTARNDVIAENPVLARLFEVVELDGLDVAQQILAQENGESPDDLADQWMLDNADQVEAWLTEARAAA